MNAEDVWTKAERDRIDESNPFATITGAETFRAKRTVEALRNALEDLIELAGSHCCEADPDPILNGTHEALLAQLEAK